MSKTFKSAFDDSNYRLELCKNAGAEHISLWIVGGGSDSASIAVAHKDMPALALAILEAAGYSEDDRKVSNPLYATEFASAMTKLADGIELQERATAEAEAQAKLEAEALMLANSAVLAVGNPPYPSIEHMSDTSLRKWLAVARRAREINKETPNA